MRVLVGCEYSGTVRDAFIACGHDAISCDLLPTERPGPHYEGDIRDLLCEPFDLAIFTHPAPTSPSAVPDGLAASDRSRPRRWPLSVY